jgi:GNAT superfamily N-acetyltransferase
MLVRPAEAADLPALIDLLGQLFSIERDFQPDPDAQRRGLELFLRAPERAVLMTVWCEEAGVIGMASAQLVISTARGALSAWVEDVIVRPEYRGQGLGRRLLAAVREWAEERGARRLQLLADRDNAPALEFYRRLGWQPTQLFAWRVFLEA